MSFKLGLFTCDKNILNDGLVHMLTDHRVYANSNSSKKSSFSIHPD